MSDHVVLSVDRIDTSGSVHWIHGSEGLSSFMGCSSSYDTDISFRGADLEEGREHDGYNETDPFRTLECRICQEEDSIKNLESPCACNGSLKYAHRKCVQRWCNEKGDITCEICHQPYEPGYTPPLSTLQLDEVAIDIDDSWTIGGSPLHLHDPRILAMAAAERHLLESNYDEFADLNSSGTSFCRSVALILMALLLLRHAMSLTSSDEEDDASAFLSVFLLRAIGFLLSCYIMAWAISMLQRRRQRQEAAAISASEVAFMLQTGQRGGMHFTITPPTSHESSSPPPTVRTQEATTPRPESPQ